MDSIWWRFFTKEDSDKAKCVLCEKLYSRKGRSTTNLKNHIQSMHKLKYVEVQNELKDRETASTSTETPLQAAKNEAKQRNANMTEYFPTMKIWDINSSVSKSLDEKIAEMLIVDNLPFTHVEELGFMRLLNKSSPQYKLKQRHYYENIVYNQLYPSAVEKVKELVSSAKHNKLSFTTDVWSDTSAGVSLMSLTGHCITDTFERLNLVLTAETLSERHTGQYLSEKFDEMINDWDLIHSDIHVVMRDAGANIKKATFLSGVQNLDCTAHKIQLIVKDAIGEQKIVVDVITKVRSFATHFNHSQMVTDELKKKQEILGQPTLSFLRDQPTR